MTRHEHCLRFLQTISDPGDIRELRVITGDKTIMPGRYTDLEAMARMAVNLSANEDLTEVGGITGVYVTINPIESEAAKRVGAYRENEMKVGARAARNPDILYRSWLAIDLDPIRPVGVSSTTEEKAAAEVMSRNVVEFLSEFGWGDPITVDSGSGYHLWYKADRLLASTDDWPRALKYISRMHNTDTVTIDTTVANAARILRLPGTMNRKGEDTDDRPHRLCKVISYPKQITPVTGTMVRELAFREGASRTRRDDADRPDLVDDVEEQIYEWCAEYGIEITDEFDKDDGMRYFILDQCPFKGEPHRGDPRKSAVTLSSKTVGYSCLGASCKEKGSTMRELREYLAKTTGHRSQVQFYMESEEKIVARLDKWWSDEVQNRISDQQMRSLFIYDEATYKSVKEAETRVGTPEEVTDPAIFGFRNWDSLAKVFGGWVSRTQSLHQTAVERELNVDAVSAIYCTPDEAARLLAAGRLMGEAALTLAARERDRVD